MATETFLEKILKTKVEEIITAQKSLPMAELTSLLNTDVRKNSLKSSIIQSKNGIIAEFKRMSPTAGPIRPTANVEDVIPTYLEADVAGLSILTDRQYFGGSKADLVSARQLTTKPILRKEFILSEYQVIESAVCGADAILLIASCMSIKKTELLARRAKELGMEVLLEMHNERELDYYNDYVDIIGINNRDLHTFKTDIRVSLEIADKLPAGVVKISESGITHEEELKMLRDAGYSGFLIGESLMRKTYKSN